MAGVEDGAGTRQLLVEVAERLFAERGLNGVSLREIGVEAGQRNTGAVRYHFGSKPGLVDAVFRYRMEPINAEREAMLAELDAGGRSHDLRGLAEAFLLPLSLQLGDVGSPSWYLRFCVHAAYLEGTAPTDLARQPWTHGVQVIKERFDEILGGLAVPPDVRSIRWSLFVGYMAHALATREQAVQHGGRGLPERSLFLSVLLDTAVALALAPGSEETDRRTHNRRTA